MDGQLTYQALKQVIVSSIDISSHNLSVISDEFSKLYVEFQSDIVKKVSIEPIPNTRFKWVRAQHNDPTKVLLFFHGGGFTMGNTQDHLELIAELVVKTKVNILSVDYRLIPDGVYPAPLDDVKQAYHWLLQNGHNNSDIAFSGISAGGLLATQLILKCQQEKLPQPKAALVMSGPSNLRFDAPSIQYNADRDWLSVERLRNIQKYYLPTNADLSLLELSPIDADYASYPVTLFQAGDYEMLLDDSLMFYEKLRKKKLNVRLNIIPGLPHCWQFFARVYPPGRVAIQGAINFLNEVFWE